MCSDTDYMELAVITLARMEGHRHTDCLLLLLCSKMETRGRSWRYIRLGCNIFNSGLNGVGWDGISYRGAWNDGCLFVLEYMERAGMTLAREELGMMAACLVTLYSKLGNTRVTDFSGTDIIDLLAMTVETSIRRGDDLWHSTSQD